MPKDPGPWTVNDPPFVAPRTSVMVWSNNYQNGQIIITTGAYGDSKAFRARSGYRTAGYFDMVRNGIPVPPANASMSKEVWRFQSPCLFQLNFKNGSSWGWYDHTVWHDASAISIPGVTSLGTALLSSAGVSLAEGEALRKFRKDIRSTGFELLTFAGELGESVRMIADRSDRLSKGIISTYSSRVLRKTSWFELFRRNQLKFLNGQRVSSQEMKRWLNGKSQYWLEACYGWRPLLNDIDTAAKAAADYVVKGTDYTKTNGSSDRVERATGRGLVSAFGRTLRAEITRTDKYVYRYGALRSVSYRNASSLEHALRHIGVSWSDVLPTAWNLIPYSFVADALTNSADVIDALTLPTSGMQYPWALRTRESEIKTVVTFDLGLNTSLDKRYWSVSAASPGTCTRTLFEWSRGPSSVIYEVPDLVVRTPSISSVVNLAALAVSRFTGVTKAWHRGIYP